MSTITELLESSTPIRKTGPPTLQYFAANDVTQDKQKAILLSACGIATYRQQTHSVVATDTAENDTDASTYTLFDVSSFPSKPYVVTVQIMVLSY